MNLVRALRDDIVDDTKAVSTTLRKAKILAARLNDVEFKQWLSFELGGYTSAPDLPDYRRLHTALLGTFSGPMGSSLAGYSIPVSLLPQTIRDAVKDLPVSHPIREVETLAQSPPDNLRHVLPTEAVMLSRGSINMSGGFVLIELYQPITRAHLEGVLDAVRTRFLDFLLGLQELDATILESEAALDALPREEVARTFNVTIHGGHNVIAADSTFGDISMTSVQPHDLESLLTFVRGLGLESDDVTQLRDALEQDERPPKGSIGKRASQWIGRMVAKAVSGSWKVALATAPEVLKEALLRYYGWK